MIDGGREEGQGRGRNKGMSLLQRGREVVENQDGVKKDESKEERGKEKRSHVITKTYEFACLIPRDAYYIMQSVVRENKDSGRKEGEEGGKRKAY